MGKKFDNQNQKKQQNHSLSDGSANWDHNRKPSQKAALGVVQEAGVPSQGISSQEAFKVAQPQ